MWFAIQKRNYFKVVRRAVLIFIFALSMFEFPPVTLYALDPASSKKQELTSLAEPKAAYDVVVVGTDPEGITAAVSAARNGLQTLLVEPRPRDMLGGLLTLGGLNSLDLNKAPIINWQYPTRFLNQGIFQEWYTRIDGTSFHVNRAANAFYALVKQEKNIDLLMDAEIVTPILHDHKITGVEIVGYSGETWKVDTAAIIDATQDADIAAAAGAPFTVLQEDMGRPNVKIAVTLVFKLSGVTNAVWNEMKQHPTAEFDHHSIWGYKEAREYVSSNPERVKIRSLNIGRQADNTVLLNTMQIFDIDPLDPESLEEAMEIGKKEAPLIAEYLRKTFKPFRNTEYAGVASELYVRESRHIIGEYRLTMGDVLNNADHSDAIAYGAYEVDIQGLGPNTPGAIVMKPKQYGVPFRSLVPLEVDGLLVVGRSASFDSLPHGSARVVPLGMATGQAAGAAAKLAQDTNKTFRELSRSQEDMAELRSRLTKQGMDLRMRGFEPPDYAKHVHFDGLRAVIGLGTIHGGYLNDDWQLDGHANQPRFTNIFRRIQQVYPEAFNSGHSLASFMKAGADSDLKWSDVAHALASFGSESIIDRGEAEKWLIENKWINKETVASFADPNKLKNGEMFIIFRDLLANVANVSVK